ncbi:metal-sulfur cluster assembly factor [Candidatus Microgenomates bacterium]|nr:MAG: metal-sulfur cluster assembly factor [Candidatus Microgenomates bacterium]
MVKENQILKQLEEVIDPELNVNIVELGLIYGVKIDKKTGDVEIKMTLTTPGCPLSDVFQEEVTKAVKKLKGVKNVIIDLVWEPMWTPDRMSEEAREKLGIL